MLEREVERAEPKAEQLEPSVAGPEWRVGQVVGIVGRDDTRGELLEGRLERGHIGAERERPCVELPDLVDERDSPLVGVPHTRVEHADDRGDLPDDRRCDASEGVGQVDSFFHEESRRVARHEWGQDDASTGTARARIGCRQEDDGADGGESP
jgi:hypothetical protein